MEREQIDYDISRRPELLHGFDDAARGWRRVLADRYGASFADAVLLQARQRFAALIPEIPYIGGDENHLTSSLVDSVRCLAVHQAMESRDKSVAETGKMLYDAVKASAPPAPIPPSERLSRVALMARRRERARRSQERRYAWDWVYDSVEADTENPTDSGGVSVATA